MCLPLAPGIAATAILAFVVSRSELLFAMRTLSAGLLYMVRHYEVQWGRYRLAARCRCCLRFCSSI